MTVGRERNEKDKKKKNRIRAKLMLFMDIVDDNDDQLYPAICSTLPVQYSR